MLCFFFFKQKTAYEMRISDWSSDVCSSDLLASAVPACAQPVHSTFVEPPDAKSGAHARAVPPNCWRLGRRAFRATANVRWSGRIRTPTCRARESEGWQGESLPASTLESGPCRCRPIVGFTSSITVAILATCCQIILRDVHVGSTVKIGRAHV